jgi:hypothetical protein
MALRGSFSLNLAAICFGNLVSLGASELPGFCAPDILTPRVPFVKVHESWDAMLKCLSDLVISGRDLQKNMKLAAWRNNRYRQAFEPTVAFWGYLAGVPWPDDDPNENPDTPLENMVTNAEHDGMTELDWSTGKVKGLLEELSYYSDVKPKKKRAWFHPPPPPPELPPAVIDEGDTPGPDIGDGGDVIRRDSGIVSVPESREKLISIEPAARNFSDFFWHPKPDHVDIENKKIVHGRQIEKMLPDQRLDGHGYNPALVWTEHSVPHNELGRRGS